MRYTVEVIVTGDLEGEVPTATLLWQQWRMDTIEKMSEELRVGADEQLQRLVQVMALDSYRLPGVAGGVYWFDDRLHFFVTVDDTKAERSYVKSFLGEYAPALLALYGGSGGEAPEETEYA